VKWAAVATWFITIDGGLVLLGFWLRAGGLRRRHRHGPRIGPELVAVHLSLAATSFALWIVYLARGGLGWAIAALCVLVGVATLGFTMFGIWLVHRLAPTPPAPDPPQAPRPVDQRLPVTVIVLHGLFAATTLTLAAIVVATAL
jgi:manganese efflux pump family protein